MRRIRKPAGLGGWAGLAVVAVLVAACGSGGGKKDADQGLVPSGDITVYAGQNKAIVDALAKGFEAKAGVKVQVQGGNDTEPVARLLKEGKKSPADAVIVEGASTLGALADRQLLALADADTSAKVDPQWNATDGTWVAISAVASVGVYNPDKIAPADLPASLLDLGGTSWKGKLGIAPTSGSFQAQVALLRKTQGVETTRAWLEAVKDNAQVYPSNADLIDAVGRGEVAFGVANHADWYTKRAEVGEQLHSQLHYFAGGDAGAFVDVSAAAVLKSSKNKTAARAFLAYLVGADGQRIIATESFGYPLAAGVVSGAGLKPLDEIKPPTLDRSKLDGAGKALDLLRQVGLI